jgi:Na+/phosphate symporter
VNALVGVIAALHLLVSVALVVVFLVALHRQRVQLDAARRALHLETAYASSKSVELEHAQRYVGHIARHFAADLQGLDAARAAQLRVTAEVWESDADVERAVRERVQNGES